MGEKKTKKRKKLKKQLHTHPKSSNKGVKVTLNPLGLKVKKKCCRSKPRCKSCPVVYTRLLKSGAFERDDPNLAKLLKEARKW
ncbi:hypothetical protein [Corynebacterium spheniscorum]|uniref:Uncharacterized protein n=1 Tax=Corynebacterium spheniscorum TaxID=185761 RepID=A0A1I2RZY2_9CORY|nr:hypothetical protein [Corynebacterium spheniscorum]KAA8720869.1 hypothetical protein F4V56_06930 [Corynebacterium spheniscorum]SFG46040.1 hypothetical protein SAMN05660282_00982 [Corynebacterium spheniscorum]